MLLWKVNPPYPSFMLITEILNTYAERINCLPFIAAAVQPGGSGTAQVLLEGFSTI